MTRLPDMLKLVPFALVVLLPAFLFTGCADDNKTSFMQKGSGSADKLFFVPPAEDIMEEQESGLDIIKNVINVTFDPLIGEDEVNRIIASVDGEVVGYDKGVNFYQIRLKNVNLKELDAARMKLLSNFKEVEAASRSLISAHKNPYYVK